MPIQLSLNLDGYNLEVNREVDEPTSDEQTIMVVTEYVINKLATDQDFFLTILGQLEAETAPEGGIH